jgi:putative colanic acid biosynthesis UDP-glucose lipid carrier transferase
MRLVRWIDDNPWVGTKVLGFFDDKLTGEVAGFPILGKLTSIPTYLRDNNTDVVYLTLPWRAESKIQRLLKELADSTASIHIIPDIFFFDLIFGGSVTYLGNLPAISLRDTPLRGINSLIKKMEDILLASAILLFTSPIMLIIAIAIKLTSPGPILFKQWRYGLNGHPIRVYKFRTMTVCEDGYTFRQATKCDARVTRVGAFLRRTSLDELPQFINVLQGRMSIVGPRPHPVALNEEYRKLVPGYMLRHKVKPGITGLAQINGWRGETDTFEKMEQRVEQDLEYLRRWSFVLDLKIIAKTLLNGAWRANAY